MACLCNSKVLFYTLKFSQYPFDGAKCEVIEIHVLALLNMATCNFIVHKAEIVETILVCRVWAIFRNGWSSVFRAGKEKCSKVEILVSPQAINNINSDYENFAILLWLQQKSQNHLLNIFKFSNFLQHYLIYKNTCMDAILYNYHVDYWTRSLVTTNEWERWLEPSQHRSLATRFKYSQK